MAAAPDDLLELVGEMMWWWDGFFRRLSRLEETGGDTVCRFGERLQALGAAPGGAAPERRESARRPAMAAGGPLLAIESLLRHEDGSIAIIFPTPPGGPRTHRPKPLRLERRLGALFSVLLDETGGKAAGAQSFRTKQELARMVSLKHGADLLASRKGRPEDLVVKYLSKLRRELFVRTRCDVIQGVRGRGYRLLARRTTSSPIDR
jgi:hypothetical protein